MATTTPTTGVNGTTTPATDIKAKDAYTAAQAEQDRAAKHATRAFRIWRGADGTGEFVEYKQDVVEGMVVLDAVHEIQATQIIFEQVFA